jgi:hypothetical protein
MPYIDGIRREMINPAIYKVIYAISENPRFAAMRPGVVSYAIFKFLSALYDEPSYQMYNEAMGVVSAAKREFARRRTTNVDLQYRMIEARGDFEWNGAQDCAPLKAAVDHLVSEIESTTVLSEKRAGIANYTITKILLAFYLFPRQDECREGAEVLGCVADRFYRSVVTPYEDKKIAECGDVYPEGVAE